MRAILPPTKKQPRGTYMLLHTITLTINDVEVKARYFHLLKICSRQLALALNCKQFKVKLRRKLSSNSILKLKPYQRCMPSLRHNLHTIKLGPRAVTQVPISAVPLCKSAKNESPFNLSMTIKSFDDSDNSNPQFDDALTTDASALQTQQWLQTHRFGSYLQTFANYSGSDVLRLSRDDLIQICGLADGIRLYNSLHAKAIAPKLTIYLAVKQTPTVYRAVYLHALSSREIVSNLASLLGVAPNQIHDIYLQGPNNIHVVITDEVIKNMKDESVFTIEIFPDHGGDKFRLLLKPTSTPSLVN